MRRGNGNLAFIAFIALLLFANLFHLSLAQTVTVSPGTTVANDKLSLGYDMDWEGPYLFERSAEQKTLTSDANVQLVRIFDFRPTPGGYPSIMPCSSWNENTHDCNNWDWTQVDAITSNIFASGAQPLFTLGWMQSTGTETQNYIPPGMSIDPSTGLPYPVDYAAYATAWVNHFKNTHEPVEYYGISNEPFNYFGWPANDQKLSNFIKFFNAVAASMRAANPDVKLGFDDSNHRDVLNYWLANGGANLDYIDFHKYDEGRIGQYSDAQLLNYASTVQIVSDSVYYGIQDAQKTYANARGTTIPVISSEFNIDSYWQTGTDPEIQEPIGAVWTALVLQSEIQDGLSYAVYYEFSSAPQTGRSGLGFGMVNEDTNQLYYPYDVYEMIGPNLGFEDSIVSSTSSSTNIVPLAWMDNNELNVLLVHKSTGTDTVSLQGMSGTLSYEKVDSSSPNMQTGFIAASASITMTGYTVMLLQQPSSGGTTPPPAICSASCNLQGYVSGTCETGTSSSSNLLLGAGEPAWVYQGNGQSVNLQALVNLAASSGANTWREAIQTENPSPVATSPNPSIYDNKLSYYQELKSDLSAKGIKLVIQTLAYSSGSLTAQQECDIINNVGTAQSDWITGWGEIIQQMNPYAIMVMNEPMNGCEGGAQPASQSEFADYRAFVTNAITAWRAIDPNIVIMVQNDPFYDPWDSTSYGFAAQPLPFSNIIYENHIYYAYTGTAPPSPAQWPSQTLYPLAYDDDAAEYAYWTAQTQAELANAKQLLTTYIDAASAPLIAKGQQVIWGEMGANLNAPNAEQYVQDFYSIAKSKGIGVLYWDLVPFAPYCQGCSPPDTESTGLLTSDWSSLNQMGQAWAQSMGGGSGSSTSNLNGIWVYQSDINAQMLKNLVSNDIFNVYLDMGYPSPDLGYYPDPTLTGIVPADEAGTSVTQAQVTADLQLLASVDPRLHLWAWVGTWSNAGTSDATGHALAKVDISTASNRAAIIKDIVKIAEMGFYGVQDDTEDITANSQTSNGQDGPDSVAFWNSEAVALHSAGNYKLAPFTPGFWDIFNTQYLPQLTGMDYLIMASPIFAAQLPEFLTHTSLPVIIDIDSNTAGDAATIISELNALPVSSYPNVVGFALYDYETYTSDGDWTVWYNWPTKNGAASSGSTGAMCQANEYLIQDDCSSGSVCCCSGSMTHGPPSGGSGPTPCGQKSCIIAGHGSPACGAGCTPAIAGLCGPGGGNGGIEYVCVPSGSTSAPPISTTYCNNLCIGGSNIATPISTADPCSELYNLTASTICDISETITTPHSCTATSSSSLQTGPWTYSPAKDVGSYNNQNSLWFLTCPLNPYQQVNPVDQRLFYTSPYDNNQCPYVAGDACSANLPDKLQTYLGLPITIYWDVFTFASATIGKFTVAEAGNLTVHNIAYSPMLESGSLSGSQPVISSGFSVNSYIYERTPAVTQKDIWTWSASFADFPGNYAMDSMNLTAEPKIGTGACTYTYNYMVNTTLNSISNYYIPFNEVNVMPNGHVTYNTFEANVIPSLAFGASVTAPNNQNMVNSYDIFSPWNYNTPESSIEMLPINTPGDLFLNDISTLVSAPVDTARNGQLSGFMSNIESKLASRSGGPLFYDQNIMDPISIAAIPSDYVFVLNYSQKSGDNFLFVLKLMPRGYYSMAGEDPSSMAQDVVNSATWSKNWNEYWSKTIDAQNYTVYLLNVIPIGPYITAVDSKLGYSSFTPENISVDDAGDLFIAGIINSGADLPGIIKIPDVLGNPQTAQVSGTSLSWAQQTAENVGYFGFTEVAASPDGAWVYAANPNIGSIYQFDSNLTQNGNPIDLTFTSSGALGATQSLQGTENLLSGQGGFAQLDISYYLYRGGLYSLKFDGSSPANFNVMDQDGAAENNADPSTDFDMSYFHHPIALANVNGYLYVVDDWRGTLGEQDGCAQSILWGLVNIACGSEAGTSFDILLLRALDSTGASVPLNPTLFNDMYSSSSCVADFTPAHDNSGKPYENGECITKSMTTGSAPSLTCSPVGICTPSITSCVILGGFNPQKGVEESCVAKSSTSTIAELGGSSQYYGLAAGYYSGNLTWPPYGWVISANISSIAASATTPTVTFCSDTNTLDSMGCTFGPGHMPPAYSNSNWLPIGPQLTSEYGGIDSAGFSAGYDGTTSLILKKSSKTACPTLIGLPFIGPTCICFPIIGCLDQYTTTNPQYSELLLANFSVENYTKYFDGNLGSSCYADSSTYTGVCNKLKMSKINPPAYVATSPFAYLESLGSTTLPTLTGEGAGSLKGCAAGASSSQCSGGGGKTLLHPNLTIEKTEIGWGTIDQITAQADVAANTIEILIDNNVVAEGTGSTGYSLFSSNSLAPGQHTVTAEDMGSGKTNHIDITVDRTPLLEFQPSQVQTYGQTETIIATPAVSADTVSMYVDGVQVATSPVPNSNTASVMYTESGLQVGSHNITASETSGNGKQATITLVVISSTSVSTYQPAAVSMTGNVGGYAVIPYKYTYDVMQKYSDLRLGTGAPVTYTWTVPQGLTAGPDCVPTSDSCTVTGAAVGNYVVTVAVNYGVNPAPTGSATVNVIPIQIPCPGISCIGMGGSFQCGAGCLSIAGVPCGRGGLGTEESCFSTTTSTTSTSTSSTSTTTIIQIPCPGSTCVPLAQAYQCGSPCTGTPGASCGMGGTGTIVSCASSTTSTSTSTSSSTSTIPYCTCNTCETLSTQCNCPSSCPYVKQPVCTGGDWECVTNLSGAPFTETATNANELFSGATNAADATAKQSSLTNNSNANTTVKKEDAASKDVKNSIMAGGGSGTVTLLPASSTIQWGDQVTLTVSSSCTQTLPANTDTLVTLYSYALTNVASDQLQAQIEGGPTYLNYVTNTTYYIANITNAHLILPPLIQYYVQNDKLFGSIWVNATHCTTQSGFSAPFQAPICSGIGVGTCNGQNVDLSNGGHATPPNSIEVCSCGIGRSFANYFACSPGYGVIGGKCMPEMDCSGNDQAVLNATQQLEYFTNIYGKYGGVYETFTTQQYPGTQYGPALAGQNSVATPALEAGGSASDMPTGPDSIGFGFENISAPVAVPLFDLYKQVIYDSPLNLTLNATAYTCTGASCTDTYPLRGYQQLIYVMTDRFNNIAYVPVETDISNPVTINMNVSTDVNQNNPNMTNVNIEGYMGVYSDFGSVFTPLPNNDIYLYFDTDLNYADVNSLNIPTNGPLHAIECAYSIMDPSNPSSCVQSNPVYTNTGDDRQPYAKLVTYAPSYNGFTSTSCSPPTNGLLSQEYFKCNINGNDAGADLLDQCPNTGALSAQACTSKYPNVVSCLEDPDSQPDPQSYCWGIYKNEYDDYITCAEEQTGGNTQFCEPTNLFTGNGICTSQMGLMKVVTTDNSGYFSFNAVACGTRQDTVTAQYYGWPPPEPIGVQQLPLSLTANVVNGECAASSSCPTVGEAELNYHFTPTQASASIQIGLVELSYGDIGFAALIISIASFMLLAFWKRIERGFRSGRDS
jgi:hypothetical protein